MRTRTLTIDFHGIPLTISGMYSPAEPSVGGIAYFEIASVKASVVVAKEISWLELSDKEWDSDVLEYLAGEALSAYEDSREADRCEADEARAEARRNKLRE